MPIDLPALLATAALVSAVAAARFLRTDRARLGVAIGLAALVATTSVAAVLMRAPAIPERQVSLRPIEVQADGYVSSSTCRACHAREYATWHDSYHRKMTQRADAHSVVGDFGNVDLQIDGKDYHLEQRGGEFWVELEDPLDRGSRPARVHKRIALTTGSHNMQAYWYETGNTRNLGLLPFTWQVAERRWISRRAAFVGPATDAVEPKLAVWNVVCIKCHTTHARPRVEFEGNVQHGADTQVAEFGIACEACHGPGAAHVAANRDPTRRYALHLSGEPDTTIVNPRRLSPELSTQVCGQCHASFDYRFDERSLRKWFREGFAYRPGLDVSKYRDVKFSGEEQFWPDGLIRVAGREYNALLHSACHERGDMTCLSCHSLHQQDDDPRPREEWADDQLRAIDGDQTCLQCHESYAKDVPSHSHHVAGSEGSRCQNCHMPHTTYGLMKGVRNHRIANPSVQSTLATGRPNACNQCHLDKTLEWTAQTLHGWYGTAVPELDADDHRIAASVQWVLKGDAAQRALLAWSLGWAPAQRASGTDWMVPYLAELLVDPYEAVRIIAERSLRTLDGYAGFRHDLIGPPKARDDAKTEALEIWRRTRPAVAAGHREAVLFTADGNLHEDVFARLLRQRDTRAIRLFE
ncbi:MAG TPA: multiheme c-type cytochrome [Planctomycetota bacterium]|nr:multiheme c-type cytochrome [Planctomycetota bacterium]